MTEPWRIHTLVFDLDDTLYPERDYAVGGFDAVDEWLRSEYSLHGFGTACRRLFAEGPRGRIFNEALESLGADASPERVARMVAVYRAHQPALQLFHDVASILEWGARHFQLALITDGYAGVQAKKIGALGLERTILCRIITDEIGRAFWKPSLKPYRRVMAYFPGDAGRIYLCCRQSEKVFYRGPGPEMADPSCTTIADRTLR